MSLRFIAALCAAACPRARQHPDAHHPAPSRPRAVRAVDAQQLARAVDLLADRTARHLDLVVAIDPQAEHRGVERARQAVDALAQDLAAFLEQDFEPQALETDFCRIALLGAKNGSAVPGPAMPIEFEIISNAAVTGIEVAVNEGPPRPVQPATARQVEFRHRVTVPVQLTGLHEDRDNYVRIRIDVGDTFYRTLRFGPRAN